MTSAKSAPPTPPFPGEIREQERRSYALNLCRHCGCFAHLTVRAAAKKIGVGRAAFVIPGLSTVEPHPLGDLAGRKAHARRLEADPAVARHDPVVVIRVATPRARDLGRLAVKIT